MLLKTETTSYKCYNNLLLSYQLQKINITFNKTELKKIIPNQENGNKPNY